jgi:ribosomal protein S18 acetylase RimI-like enzyme
MVLKYIPCTTEQLSVLGKLARQTFSDAFKDQNNPEDFQSYLNRAFALEQLQMEIETKGTTFYLVYGNEKLCGYFKINRNGAQTDVKQADSMEMERIYVLSSFQGQGIGTKIMAHVLHMAKEVQMSFLWLGVWEKNIAAIRFYQRLGFEKFGTHPYYIGNDRQTDWLMRKELHNLESK